MSAIAFRIGNLEMPESTPNYDDPNAIDVALMKRVAVEDERAFRELVERHQNAVIGTVAKMLGDRSEAEDIAQRVFLRVWKHAKRWRPDAKFTTYLFTITRNLVFNELRRRRRARLIPLESDDPDHPPTEHTDHSTPSASEQTIHAELQEAISQAIASLPEAQRMAVVLRRYEEMPYEDIAKVLGTSVSSVKSLLFRARAELKERLKSYFWTAP